MIKRMRTLLLRRSAVDAGMDANATDRLVSAVVDGEVEQEADNTSVARGQETIELLRLVSAIRQIGSSDSPLPESGVDAIMLALQDEENEPVSANAWRERFGMFAGFAACTATLGSGLLLVMGGSWTMAPPAAAPPAPVLAFAVASAAALVSLLLQRRFSLRSPALPLLGLGSILVGSCAPADSGISTVELPSTALHVFEEGQKLWDVRDILESDGGIWVLTAEAPYLRGYDRYGRMLGEFGANGKGPGELTNPWALTDAPTAGDVVVWDFGTRSLLTFDQKGDFMASSPAPFAVEGFVRADIRGVSFGDPFRVVVEGAGHILAAYPGGISGAGGFWNGRVLRVEDGRAEPRVLVDFARDLAGAADHVSAIGPAPVPLWDRCPDGRVAVLDPVDRSLLLYAPEHSGEPVRIQLPWTGRPFSREEYLAYLRAAILLEFKQDGISDAEVDRAAEGLLAQVGEHLPAETPLGIDVRCSAGRVWIQEFDGSHHALGYGRLWRSVSLTSRSPGFQRIVFPDGFGAMRFSDSLAIGVFTYADKLQRVAIVRLGGQLLK